MWYKDAAPISPVKIPRYRVLVGGSLQINGLLPDDTGMFQCFARNLAGEIQTNTYLAVTSGSASSKLSAHLPPSSAHLPLHPPTTTTPHCFFDSQILFLIGFSPPSVSPPTPIYLYISSH